LGPFSSDDGPPAPLGDPTLPEEVTHFWVASTLSRRNALYWSAEGVWEATGWLTPDHEDAIAGLLGDGPA
jgi:hypothetical protein